MNDVIEKEKLKENELKIIDQRELLGHEFKIYGTCEEPLFLARDVAEWIDYDVSSLNKMIRHVDEDEKVRKNVPTLGGNQESWLLTEDGLYEVLMQSRKPIAKEFKKEVKKILKTIRKTGGFISNADLMVNTYFGVLDDNYKSTIKGLFISIEKEQYEKQLLANQNQALTTENLILEQQVKESEPKVTYYDKILSSKGAINIGQIAKDYGLSAKRLNQILHEEKVQYKQGSQWLLYSKYQSEGYTKSHTNTIEKNGESYTKLHTKWTQKGRLFIHELLKKKGIMAVMDRELDE
ncbi:phage antirepressor KilAC domain-containing protein [Bacillus sp. FSL P4-0334]|uniref:phage antirepressor KilAC domain-containing protein n=1 Tax=Bacillus sp. FSL P4-0334 TaxID=2954520 RepID=UPI0030F94A2E